MRANLDEQVHSEAEHEDGTDGQDCLTNGHELPNSMARPPALLERRIDTSTMRSRYFARMTDLHLRALAALVLAAGCGDDGERCGEGTVDVAGVCTPANLTTCGDGTKLENGRCVIDPATCQAGTVLIAGHCVDPSRSPVVDLEESPEPNGLRIVAGAELSTSPAGIIALTPGVPYVIHGHITPFRDADDDGQLDPDIDTYRLTVGGPTLLAISVDGVGGVQGAFFATADAVPHYERYGLNLAGDTSQRRLFLPAAGSYSIAIADTRSLALGSNAPAPAGRGGAAGSADAEYYATITAEALPAPVPLAAAGGLTTVVSSTLASDEVKLFSVALDAGNNQIRLAMAGTAAAASLAVLRQGQLAGYSDETATPPAVANLTIAGPLAQDAVTIVVDTVYNYGAAPEPLTLTITPPGAPPP